MRVSTGASLVHSVYISHLEVTSSIKFVKLCGTAEGHRVYLKMRQVISKPRVMCDMSCAGSVPCCGYRTQRCGARQRHDWQARSTG